MKFLKLFSFGLTLALLFSSCKFDPYPVPVIGCMMEDAMNYEDESTHPGPCEFAERFLPIGVGNYWKFEDELTIPVLGSFPIQAEFTMTKDTTINGKSYTICEEVIGSTAQGGFDNTTRRVYRTNSTGNVWRMDLADSTLTEELFLSYPLEINNDWYGTEDEVPYYARVIGKSLLDLPVGSFDNVYEVEYKFVTANADSLPEYDFVVHFAEDIGWARNDLSFEVDLPYIGPYNFELELELTEYQVVAGLNITE